MRNKLLPFALAAIAAFAMMGCNPPTDTQETPDTPEVSQSTTVQPVSLGETVETFKAQAVSDLNAKRETARALKTQYEDALREVRTAEELYRSAVEAARLTAQTPSTGMGISARPPDAESTVARR